MHILFIYFEIQIQIYNQIGLSYLSAVLKKHGHKVSLIRVNKPDRLDMVAKEVKRISPNLVGLSFVSNFSHLARELSGKIKKEINVPIVAGGIHATIRPLETIKYPGVDYVAVGEGEEALLELVEKIGEKSGTTAIRNIWAKIDGEIFKNPVRDLLDLDTLPVPDIDIFYQKPTEVQRVTFMTQRGCPYSCTYCCNEYLNKLYKNKGPIVRKRSLEKVMDDIGTILKTHPNVKDLNFDDDTFTVDKQRVKEFCSLIKERYNIPFAINSRPELIDEEIAKALKDAGCFIVRIGIESGSEKFRKKYLARNMTDAEIRRAFSVLKKAGLDQVGFFIYGFPHETEDEMKMSYDFLAELDPSGGSQVSVFYPYPETTLEKECVELGLMTGKNKTGFFGGGTTLSFPGKVKNCIGKYYELSEDLYHVKGEDLRYVKKFYPGWYYPYIFLSLFIKRKYLWRSLVKLKLYYLKPAFTVRAGW
ncbi:MAG: B12-binding domain-containing radical SAM protein [Candidatus Omnitrophica bacterium]|nr:B12-binding domain-containing radical SAM protein [Candidatus Omnitrophota bacterium]